MKNAWMPINPSRDACPFVGEINPYKNKEKRGSCLASLCFIQFEFYDKIY